MNPIKSILSLLVVSCILLGSMSYMNYSFHKNRVLGTQSQLYNCLDILERTPKKTTSNCNDYLCTVSFGNLYNNQLNECNRINDKLEKYLTNYNSLPQVKIYDETIIRY